MPSPGAILTGFVHKMPACFRNAEITTKQKNAISAAFYECDLEHKGYLDKEDIKMAILSLFGYKPSKLEVNQLMQEYATLSGDSVQGVKLEDFSKAMSYKMAIQDEDELIRQTFLIFDSQCRGFLTINDLKKAMSQVAPHLPLHAVESAFREIDRDGDGRISYKDFEFMMKYNTEDRL